MKASSLQGPSLTARPFNTIVLSLYSRFLIILAILSTHYLSLNPKENPSRLENLIQALDIQPG